MLHRLLISECKPSSSQNVVLEVPSIAPVIAGQALYWTFSNLFWKFSLFGLSYKISPQSRLGLTKFIYIVSKALRGRVVDFQDFQDFLLSDVWTYRLLNKMLLSLSVFLSAYWDLRFLCLPQQQSFFEFLDEVLREL